MALHYQRKTLLSRLAAWILRTELHAREAYLRQRMDERDEYLKKMLVAQRELDRAKSWELLLSHSASAAANSASFRKRIGFDLPADLCVSREYAEAMKEEIKAKLAASIVERTMRGSYLNVRQSSAETSWLGERMLEAELRTEPQTYRVLIPIIKKPAK